VRNAFGTGLKFQLFLLIALIFVGSILATSRMPTARATGSMSTSQPQTVVISGTKVFIAESFDICSDIPFLGTCPVSFSVSENYTQPITVQFQDSTFLLANSPQTTGITLTPGAPNLVLILQFALGSNSYSYPVPLPALKAPGTFTVDIPLSQILSSLTGIGLPLSLLNKIASFDFVISFVSSIEGDVSLSGFTSTQGPMYWNSPITEFYNSTLTGNQSNSSIGLGNLKSEFSVGADLTFSVPLLPPIHLIPHVNYDLISFGSSSLIPIGDWYQVEVSSQYSEPSGSGWYMSGSAATFSVQDQSASASGTTYNLIGWTGTGAGSYTGSETNPSITVNNPVQETANWQATPAQSSPLSTSAAIMIAGATILGLAIAGLVAFVLLKRRAK